MAVAEWCQRACMGASGGCAWRRVSNRSHVTSHPLTAHPPWVAIRPDDCGSQADRHTWNQLADVERAPRRSTRPQTRHRAQHTAEALQEIYFWIRVMVAASLFARWWRIVSRICGGRSAEEFRHRVVRVACCINPCGGADVTANASRHALTANASRRARHPPVLRWLGELVRMAYVRVHPDRSRRWLRLLIPNAGTRRAANHTADFWIRVSAASLFAWG
jgi:hypothetical protein